jgi:hypothetical protein
MNLDNSLTPSRIFLLEMLPSRQAVVAPNWRAAVEDEYEKMMLYGVWKEVDADNVEQGTKILTTTWAMKKKKSNSTFRARLNTRGFEQVDGLDYSNDDKAAPVVKDITN